MTRDEIMGDVYLAGRVLRYHTWPVLTRETVAEHSHAMAMIWLELFGVPRAEVFVYILQHDLPELHTGDQPYPVKQRYPDVASALRPAENAAKHRLGLCPVALTNVELACVKICDLLQMYRFGRHERLLGNAYAGCVEEDTAQHALSLACTINATIFETVKDWLNSYGWQSAHVPTEEEVC